MGPSTPDTGFLFDPANAPIVGGWGLIVSLVGFALTLWQLLRTRSAIEAARTATNRLRERITNQDIVAQATSAHNQVRMVRREIQSASWAAASDGLDALRTLLLSIYRRELVPRSIRDRLEPYLKDLIDFSTYLERRGTQGPTEAKRTHIVKRLREISDILTDLTIHLSDSIK